MVLFVQTVSNTTFIKCEYNLVTTRDNNRQRSTSFRSFGRSMTQTDKKHTSFKSFRRSVTQTDKKHTTFRRSVTQTDKKHTSILKFKPVDQDNEEETSRYRRRNIQISARPRA